MNLSKQNIQRQIAYLLRLSETLSNESTLQSKSDSAKIANSNFVLFRSDCRFCKGTRRFLAEISWVPHLQLAIFY